MRCCVFPYELLWSSLTAKNKRPPNRSCDFMGWPLLWVSLVGLWPSCATTECQPKAVPTLWIWLLSHVSLTYTRAPPPPWSQTLGVCSGSFEVFWSLSAQKPRSFTHFLVIHPQAAGTFQGCVSNWQVRVLSRVGGCEVRSRRFNLGVMKWCKPQGRERRIL